MLLYHNKVEYSRVVELVEVTEDGVFLKDQTPDDYGGAVLQVELVHLLTLTDISGYIEIIKLDNPPPMDKDRKEVDGAITIDGVPYRSGGGGAARDWTTKPSKHLPPTTKAKADDVFKIMRADGDFGSVI